MDPAEPAAGRSGLSTSTSPSDGGGQALSRNALVTVLASWFRRVDMGAHLGVGYRFAGFSRELSKELRFWPGPGASEGTECPGWGDAEGCSARGSQGAVISAVRRKAGAGCFRSTDWHPPPQVLPTGRLLGWTHSRLL